MIQIIILCVAAGLIGAQGRRLGDRLLGRARIVARITMLAIAIGTVLVVSAMAWALANAFGSMEAGSPEARQAELAYWITYGSYAFAIGLVLLGVAATTLLLLWWRDRNSSTPTSQR